MRDKCYIFFFLYLYRVRTAYHLFYYYQSCLTSDHDKAKSRLKKAKLEAICTETLFIQSSRKENIMWEKYDPIKCFPKGDEEAAVPASAGRLFWKVTEESTGSKNHCTILEPAINVRKNLPYLPNVY